MQTSSSSRIIVTETSLPDVKLVTPRKHRDERGWFEELFNARDFATAGLPGNFVQDNMSFSKQGVLRGLHYQLQEPQAKLVRVLAGVIWDVVVDLRTNSGTFGKWASFELSAEKDEWLFVPEGFAHGFLVLSETATVLYKTSQYWNPSGERCIRWSDPTLKIQWPLRATQSPIVSPSDAAGSLFARAELPSPAK